MRTPAIRATSRRFVRRSFRARPDGRAGDAGIGTLHRSTAPGSADTAGASMPHPMRDLLEVRELTQSTEDAREGRRMFLVRMDVRDAQLRSETTALVTISSQGVAHCAFCNQSMAHPCGHIIAVLRRIREEETP